MSVAAEYRSSSVNSRQNIVRRSTNINQDNNDVRRLHAEVCLVRTRQTNGSKTVAYSSNCMDPTRKWTLRFINENGYNVSDSNYAAKAFDAFKYQYMGVPKVHEWPTVTNYENIQCAWLMVN